MAPRSKLCQTGSNIKLFRFIISLSDSINYTSLLLILLPASDGSQSCSIIVPFSTESTQHTIYCEADESPTILTAEDNVDIQDNDKNFLLNKGVLNQKFPNNEYSNKTFRAGRLNKTCKRYTITQRSRYSRKTITTVTFCLRETVSSTTVQLTNLTAGQTTAEKTTQKPSQRTTQDKAEAATFEAAQHFSATVTFPGHDGPPTLTAAEVVGLVLIPLVGIIIVLIGILVCILAKRKRVHSSCAGRICLDSRSEPRGREKEDSDSQQPMKNAPEAISSIDDVELEVEEHTESDINARDAAV